VFPWGSPSFSLVTSCDQRITFTQGDRGECASTAWVVSDWSTCDQEDDCGLTRKARVALCADANGNVVNETQCDEGRYPELQDDCQEDDIVEVIEFVSEAINYHHYALWGRTISVTHSHHFSLFNRKSSHLLSSPKTHIRLQTSSTVAS